MGWCEFWCFRCDVVEDSAHLGCGVASRIFERTYRPHTEKRKARFEDACNLFLENLWSRWPREAAVHPKRLESDEYSHWMFSLVPPYCFCLIKTVFYLINVQRGVMFLLARPFQHVSESGSVQPAFSHPSNMMPSLVLCLSVWRWNFLQSVTTLMPRAFNKTVWKFLLLEQQPRLMYCGRCMTAHKCMYVSLW